MPTSASALPNTTSPAAGHAPPPAPPRAPPRARNPGGGAAPPPDRAEEREHAPEEARLPLPRLRESDQDDAAKAEPDPHGHRGRDPLAEHHVRDHRPEQ